MLILFQAYHRIRIRQKVFQGVKETLIFYQLRVYVMKLCDTDCCCLAHIGILILQALAEGLTQILCDLINTDAAHGAYSQSTDKWIWIFTILSYKNNTILLFTGLPQ